MKTVSMRLPDNEETMLKELKIAYQEINKGIKVTDSMIMRISLINEYERIQNNR